MRFFILLAAIVFLPLSAIAGDVFGIVQSGGEPIADARVRFQGANDFVVTDAEGFFRLESTLQPGTFTDPVAVGKQGYYNIDKTARVGDTLLFELQPLPEGDNYFYEFKDPDDNCSVCHQPLYDQWKTAAHARAATNPMLLQMYSGEDASGQEGVAPGFKLDFPDDAGDCADCHAPAAAIDDPGYMDLLDVQQFYAVEKNGVFCDFCHKINRVEVNYATGVNGSIFLKRPSASAERDINIGGLDDVTTFWMGGTYNPVYRKSDFCSGCHQYKNLNGLIVDDTYDSWAESEYAAAGVHCQDCHMRPFSDSLFVTGVALADAVKRDPGRLYNHYFRRTGLSDSTETAGLHVDAEAYTDSLVFNVIVSNREAGHNLPTGVSFRHIVLVLQGLPESALQEDQNVLPEYTGTGDISDGNYSGMPGKVFGLLTATRSGQVPAPNWLADTIYADTRIAAGAHDTTRFVFSTSFNEPLQITAKLEYRAVYKTWADAKGWDMRAYTMADTQLTILPNHMADPSNPESFTLLSNYPNPFNSSTVIRYALPAPADVRLRVYDIQGRLTATLTKGYHPAGEHLFRLNASGWSSGVYYLRLDSDQSSRMIKMLLVK